MDVVAHALWTNAIYKGIQKRKRTWREIVEIIFWSDFPDIATFVLFGIYNFVTDGFTYQPGSEYFAPRALVILPSVVYSVPIFISIFLLLWLIRKKPYWPLGAWFIHVVIDIFTHADFFPPQFLWPFSTYTFSGIPWDTPWFWFLTYALLVIIYAYWFFDLRKKGI